MVPDLGEATVRPVPVWTVTVTSRASSNRLFAAVIEPEAVEDRNDWGMAGRDDYQQRDDRHGQWLTSSRRRPPLSIRIRPSVPNMRPCSDGCFAARHHNAPHCSMMAALRLS